MAQEYIKNDTIFHAGLTARNANIEITKYDDLINDISTDSANWDSVYSNVNTNSGSWQDTNSSVYANSASWGSALTDATSYVHANFLPLSGGTITSNLVIDGDLSVLGSTTTLETTTTVTSSFNITNHGTTEALTVIQTGSTDIATFYDDATTALVIKDGGNIGINVVNPTEKLDVGGNIKASGDVTAGSVTISTGGKDTDWTSTHSTVYTNSASWDSALTDAAGYVHANFLPLSGGTVTGNATVQNTLSANTIDFVNIDFTGIDTLATSITARNNFIPITIGGETKYLRLYDVV